VRAAKPSVGCQQRGALREASLRIANRQSSRDTVIAELRALLAQRTAEWKARSAARRDARGSLTVSCLRSQRRAEDFEQELDRVHARYQQVKEQQQLLQKHTARCRCAHDGPCTQTIASLRHEPPKPRRKSKPRSTSTSRRPVASASTATQPAAMKATPRKAKPAATIKRAARRLSSAAAASLPAPPVRRPPSAAYSMDLPVQVRCPAPCPGSSASVVLGLSIACASCTVRSQRAWRTNPFRSRARVRAWPVAWFVLIVCVRVRALHRRGMEQRTAACDALREVISRERLLGAALVVHLRTPSGVGDPRTVRSAHCAHS
jgi:hypothetical protein